MISKVKCSQRYVRSSMLEAFRDLSSIISRETARNVLHSGIDDEIDLVSPRMTWLPEPGLFSHGQIPKMCVS
jgi:hypothetical protein